MDNNEVVKYLFKVNTRKFSAFVVAEDWNIASKKFYDWLNSKDYGFYSDRTIVSCEKLASTNVNCLKDNITNFEDKLFI